MSKMCCVFAAVAMLSGSAFAAEAGSSRVTPNLNKGTKVIEGSGYINLMADEMNIQFSYGRFVANKWEVALVAGLRDSDRYMSTELGIRTEYNLVRNAAVVPFLSAGVVWADVEADEWEVDTDAAVFSLGGGVKYFLRNNVALALSASYLVATDDIIVDYEENELEDDDIRVLFSIRFHFN
jgi:opacity protein-like surface antigen